MLRELKANPHRVVGIKFVTGKEKIGIKTEKGQTCFIDPMSFRPADRYNNGSFVVDVKESGNVVEVWKEIEEDNTKE